MPSSFDNMGHTLSNKCIIKIRKIDSYCIIDSNNVNGCVSSGASGAMKNDIKFSA